MLQLISIDEGLHAQLFLVLICTHDRFNHSGSTCRVLTNVFHEHTKVRLIIFCTYITVRQERKLVYTSEYTLR